jgi:hypothetical protein
MKLSCASFNAADVMSIAVNPQPRAGVWFLNWEIRAKKGDERNFILPNVTSGSGLYGLCFDGKLIYIGSYLGKQKSSMNPFGGDVVEDRWWTHIGSITARGDHVHIAPRSLAGLRQQLGPNHAMTRGFLGTKDATMLNQDAGNLAPLRRLLFAATHQSVFFAPGVNPEQVLARFTFVYVRVSEMPTGMDAQSLSVHIETAEKCLIGSLSPCCNTQNLIAGVPQSDVSYERIEALLRHTLTTNLQPAKGTNQADIAIEEANGNHAPVTSPMIKTDDEALTAEETPAAPTAVTTPVKSIDPQMGDADARNLFWDRLPEDPHPSRAVIDSLVGLASRLGVEVLYTKTNSGDIRFRTNTIRGAARIFMTLYWQPRLQRFIVRSQCSKEQAVVFMGPLEDAESVAKTRENEPQLSRIEVLAKISRTTALRQVFFQALQNVQPL